MNKFYNFVKITLSWVFLTLVLIPNIAVPTHAEIDPAKLAFCNKLWDGDDGKTIYKLAVTDYAAYLLNSKSALTPGTKMYNWNLNNMILRASGYKIAEKGESGETPFEKFGLAGLNFSSYKGEWKYFDVDPCEEESDVSDLGEYYEGRKDPISSYQERAHSKDVRVREHYTSGLTGGFFRAFGDNVSNILLSISKTIVAITLAIIGVSLGDISEMMGFGESFQTTTVTQFYNTVFLPLVSLMWILTAVYLIYYGIWKRQYREAAIGGLLKPIISMTIAIAIAVNPKWISIPNKIAVFGQSVVLSTLTNSIDGDGSTSLCTPGFDTSKPGAPGEVYDGNQSFLEQHSTYMKSVIGCRMWSEVLFKPFVVAQFGSHYEDLEKLNNVNSEWVGEPKVWLTSEPITNWGLLHVSVMSGNHTSIDEIDSPLINSIHKDWYRIVDALSNYEEIVLTGGGSTAANAIDGAGGGGDEFFLSEKEMEENAIKIWSVMKEWGLNDNQIAGMLGNWETESTLNPKLVESIYVNYTVPNVVDVINEKGPTAENMFTISPQEAISLAGGNPSLYVCELGHCMGTGLGQWTAQPVVSMFEYAKKNKKELLSLEFQLEWALTSHDQDHTYHNRLACYGGMDAGTPEEAAMNFLNYWEYGNGGWPADSEHGVVKQGKRMSLAKKWKDKMSGWKEDKKFAKEILKSAKGTLKPGDCKSAAGGGEGGDSSSGGPSSGQSEEYPEPLDYKVLDEWNYWIGARQGHRFSYTLVMTIFAIIASILPLVFSLTAATYGIGITLLSVLAPIFLLLGVWGGKGNQILKQYLGSLISTVAKRIVATFLMVLSILITTSTLKLINEVGYIKALIFMIVSTYVFWRVKDKLMDSFTRVNMGSLNLSHFTKPVSKLTNITKKGGKTAALMAKSGAESKKQGGKYFDGVKNALKQEIENNRHRSGRNGFLGSYAAAYDAGNKHENPNGISRSELETISCQGCGTPLKNSIGPRYIDNDGLYFCDECALERDYENMNQANEVTERFDTETDWTGQDPKKSKETTTAVSLDRNGNVIGIDNSQPTLHKWAKDTPDGEDNLFTQLESGDGIWVKEGDGKEVLDYDKLNTARQVMNNSMAVTQADINRAMEEGKTFNNYFIPQPIMGYVDVSEVKKAFDEAKKNGDYDAYVKILEEGWVNWFKDHIQTRGENLDDELSK